MNLITSLMECIGVLMVGLYYSLPKILFGCLIWVASMSIEFIIEDVKIYLPTLDLAGHRVVKWKKSYHVILNYIEEINQFYGVPLVIMVSNMFGEIVLRTSAVIADYPNNLLVHFISIGRMLIILSLMVYATEKMKEKVTVLVAD